MARIYTLLILAGIGRAHADNWEQRFPGGTPPPALRDQKAAWTGSEMIVWGGLVGDGGGITSNTGSRLNPLVNSWTAMNTAGAPSGRYANSSVWTGTEMIVWGGSSGGTFLNTGGRYNPAANSWAPVSISGAPSARWVHGAVWTGSEMIVWGGHEQGGTYVNNGGRYNPAGNNWTTINTAGAPRARQGETAVWTGSEMIIWGGSYYSSGDHFLNDGGRYRPATNSWTEMNTTGAPAGRDYYAAVWTGTEMVVWGGTNGGSNLNGGVMNTGGRYNPATNSWTPMNTVGAPNARWSHRAVWTGREMIVWGGRDETSNLALNTGARYNPAADSWTAMSTIGAPAGRAAHKAVWTGREMIVWGGYYNDFLVHLNDTFSYTPGGGSFQITDAVIENGNLLASFPSDAGRSYTLWQSDTMGAGSWVTTGLPALTGTGEALTFTFPVPAAARLFVRVQAGP